MSKRVKNNKNIFILCIFINIYLYYYVIIACYIIYFFQIFLRRFKKNVFHDTLANSTYNIRYGMAGDVNIQGEEVKKLDVLANDLFINMLRSSFTTCLLVSEENKNVIEVILAVKKNFVILCYQYILI